jgi:transcriptional regulator with XRE-family HTH domain
MIIGDRLRTLREQKNLSQGDIEKRTGLLRCYISRVENGHTVPSIDTLEKMSRALEIPLYQLFYEGDNPPALPKYKASKLHRGECLERKHDSWRDFIAC